MQTGRPSPLRLAQRILLAGLLLCMALAQSLSFAHRTLHQDVRMLAHAHQAGYAESHSHDHGTECDHDMFGRLFAGHEEGDETCRLIDGATAFLELNSPLSSVLFAPNAHVLIASNAAALAAWRAPLFEARGPPAFSL